VLSRSTIDSLRLTQQAFYRESRFADVFVSLRRAPEAEAATLILLGVVAFLLNLVILRLLAQERTQIAVLKDFGDPTRRLVTHYLLLVGLLVLGGGGLGLWGGAEMGSDLAAMYSRFFRYPFLRFRFEPAVALSGMAIASATAIVGTLFAVLRAAALPPASDQRLRRPARPLSTRRRPSGTVEDPHRPRSVMVGAPSRWTTPMHPALIASQPQSLPIIFLQLAMMASHPGVVAHRGVHRHAVATMSASTAPASDAVIPPWLAAVAVSCRDRTDGTDEMIANRYVLVIDRDLGRQGLDGV
jgi:hypothetical protein